MIIQQISQVIQIRKWPIILTAALYGCGMTQVEEEAMTILTTQVDTNSNNIVTLQADLDFVERVRDLRYGLLAEALADSESKLTERDARLLLALNQLEQTLRQESQQGDADLELRLTEGPLHDAAEQRTQTAESLEGAYRQIAEFVEEYRLFRGGYSIQNDRIITLLEQALDSSTTPTPTGDLGFEGKHAYMCIAQTRSDGVTRYFWVGRISESDMRQVIPRYVSSQTIDSLVSHAESPLEWSGTDDASQLQAFLRNLDPIDNRAMRGLLREGFVQRPDGAGSVSTEDFFEQVGYEGTVEAYLCLREGHVDR